MDFAFPTETGAFAFAFDIDVAPPPRPIRAPAPVATLLLPPRAAPPRELLAEELPLLLPASMQVPQIALPALLSSTTVDEVEEVVLVVLLLLGNEKFSKRW